MISGASRFSLARSAWLVPAMVSSAAAIYLFAVTFVAGLPVLFGILGVGAAAVALAVVYRPIWGFYALVAVFCAESVLRFNQLFTGTKILGTLLLFAWLLDAMFRRSYRLPRAAVLWAPPALLASATLSLLAAERLTMGVAKLGTLVQLNLLVLITATVLRQASDVRALARVLLASTTVSALAGFFMVASGRQVNLEGLIGQRNHMGLYLAMATPVIFFFFSRVSAPARVGLLAIGGGFLAAEALSYSRGGFLVLMGSAALSFWFASRGQRIRGAFALAALVFAVAAFLPATVWERLSTIVPAVTHGEETVGLRYQLWDVSLRMVRENPWLGVGPGNYLANFMRFGGIWGLKRAPLTSHNSFLSVAAELGLVGMSVFIVLCLLTLATYARTAWRARRSGQDEIADLATCFGISTLAVVASGMHGGWEYLKYFWVLIGVSAALEHVLASALSDEKPAAIPAAATPPRGAAGPGT